MSLLWMVRQWQAKHNATYLEVFLFGDELVVDVGTVVGHQLLPSLSKLLSVRETSNAFAQTVDHLQGVVPEPTALLKHHTKHDIVVS